MALNGCVQTRGSLSPRRHRTAGRGILVAKQPALEEGADAADIKSMILKTIAFTLVRYGARAVSRRQARAFTYSGGFPSAIDMAGSDSEDEAVGLCEVDGVDGGSDVAKGTCWLAKRSSLREKIVATDVILYTYNALYHVERTGICLMGKSILRSLALHFRV
jgi:hypothetical protein